MPRRLTRGETQPAAGSKFLSQVVADNVRDYRQLRRLSQESLADLMATLHHEWSRATVSDVENAKRNVTVDELGSLALALGATMPQLMDPTGPGFARREGIDVGFRREADGVHGESQSLGAFAAQAWVNGRVVVTIREGDQVGAFYREVAPELHPRAAAVVENVAQTPGWDEAR